jgi:protein DJ-1
LNEFKAADKTIALICHAVTTISTIEGFKSFKVTRHPSVKDHFGGWDYSDEDVVVSKNLITFRGPGKANPDSGTAFKFALQIVEIACGRKTMEKLMQHMVCE